MGSYCNATDVQSDLESLQITLGEEQAPSRAVVDGRYVAAAEARIHGTLKQCGYASLPLMDAGDKARLKEIALDFVVAAVGRLLYSEGSDPDSNAVILQRERNGRDLLAAIRDGSEPLSTDPGDTISLGAFAVFEQTDEDTLESAFTHDQEY